MYCFAHKTATLTSIQHTVPPPPPDFQTFHGPVTHARASLVDYARLKSVAKKY